MRKAVIGWVLAAAASLCAPAGAAAVCGNATTEFSSIDVPHAIPDNGSVSATLPILLAGRLNDVDVKTTIAHPFVGDLKLELIAPDGTVVLLAQQRGGGEDDYSGTTFDDEASLSITQGSPPFSGSFRPQAPLSALDGKQQYGIWQLRVTDMSTRDTGTLQSFKLVLSSHGCELLNHLPVPAFTLSPSSALTFESVAFNAAESTDPDGTIERYEWDLDGNGSFETDSGGTPEASRTYSAPGVYNVKLRTTDDLGGAAEITRALSVRNRAPTAALSGPTSSVAGRSVTFAGSNSSDRDGVIKRYEWDLDGNGTFERSGTAARVSRTYSKAGTYRVRLRVKDDRDAAATTSMLLTVDPPAAVVPKTPVPPARPRDRSAPRVRALFGRRLSIRAALGRKALQARCSEACSISIALRLDRRAVRRLGLRSGRVARGLAAGATAVSRTLRLRLTRASLRRRLKRARGARGRLRLRAVDAAGNSTTFSRRIRLVR